MNEIEKERLSLEAANNLIDEAVRLGLITRVELEVDGRVTLYHMSEEQMEKLYRIREGASNVFAITAAQAKDPGNSECGRTNENKSWCANINTEMVLRHDELYEETKKRLDKWRHLLPAVALVLVGGAIYLATALEVLAATLNGGGY